MMKLKDFFEVLDTIKEGLAEASEEYNVDNLVLFYDDGEHKIPIDDIECGYGEIGGQDVLAIKLKHDHTFLQLLKKILSAGTPSSKDIVPSDTVVPNGFEDLFNNEEDDEPSVLFGHYDASLSVTDDDGNRHEIPVQDFKINLNDEEENNEEGG